MKTPRTLLAVSAAIIGLFSGSACSKKSGHDHAHGHHHHTAPHGGTLVEVGEHQFNLELVRDAAAGTLTVYVLDGHAENFVRISQLIIPVVVIASGAPHTLELQATANAATGETVGETSQFVAQADWLKAADKFDVTIPRLEIRGAKFSDVKTSFPKTSDDHDKH